MPFEFDLISQDLDSHYPEFSRGSVLHWGIAVAALPESWDKDVTVQGVDWRARFALPKGVKVPRSVEQSGRTYWKTIGQHCVLIVANTGKTGMNEARDTGRPTVRALLGLIRREVPVLLAGSLLWEGAVVPTGKRLKASSVDWRLMPAKSIEPESLHRLGLRMARVSARALPLHVRRALEWLTLARAAKVRPEMFVHLWLAILTLAGHGQRKHDDDMARITRYTKTMTYGPGVLSPIVVGQLNERLRRAKTIRHNLVHRADDSDITEGLLASLETDAFQLVDFELAKIGTPLSA